MVTVFVNNVPTQVLVGSSVFQACRKISIEVPNFCYHKRLLVAGNCRMCLVEVSGSPKPVVACAAPVFTNMQIFTESALVKKARESVLEFLLLNHPLDCPICDQGGECDLQEFSLTFGSDQSRFYFFKRSAIDKACGPLIKTVMTRCIHCTRCVRFFSEIAGWGFLGFVGRGISSEVSLYRPQNIITNLSGNLIDLCPVGYFINSKLNMSVMYFFYIILKILVLIVPLLVGVAYFTLAERKYLSAIQRRRGPNVVGLFGLFQPLADGLKLLLKETVLPTSSNVGVFLLAPVISFTLSLVGWAVIPLNSGMVLSDLNLGLLYIFAVSSLAVYGIIMAGWASNSKYAFLGGLRSAAQMISYEVSMGFVLVNIMLCVGSLNLTEVVVCQKSIWLFIPLFPIFLVFFVSILAETNRHPFDMPEAEAELVSGYNVEYSAMGFALFFLGEYGSMILMSALTVILFFGGWLAPFNFVFFDGLFTFGLKTFCFICLFIWARAAFPRYRYDQLMRLGWKVFLPLSMSWVLFSSGLLLSFNGFN